MVALAIASAGLGTLASCSEPYGAGADSTLPDGDREGSLAAEGSAADAGKEAGFCTTQGGDVAFCADFDDKQPITTIFNGSAGRVFVDENVATSPPSSLRVIGAGAFVEKTFVQTPHLPYVLSAAVRVAPFEAGAPPTLLPIRIQDDGAADCSFNVEILPDSGQVTVAATESDAGRTVRTFPFGRQIIPGTWARVRLEIANGTSVVRVALTVDGLPAVPFTDTHCPAVTGKPTLSLGVLFGDGAEVSFDDVVFHAN